VVAAPPYSLKLRTWCFPVTGCVGYHGYFAEADAQAEARRLEAEGFEVSVYGVPAYSTLGWFEWMGGDPLLNTFIAYPEGELARIIFHELAHQVAYAKDDTEFNESFATAVERLGGARWLATQAGPAAREEYTRFNERRVQFRRLLLDTRQRLTAVYADAARPFAGDRDLPARKAQVYADMQAQYATLKAQWGGYAAYDAFFGRVNNATLGAQAAYDALVPGFEALFEREGRDWPRFYDAVRVLARQSHDQRRAVLATHEPVKNP
jgi:predicted aminopeptidase